MHTYRIVIPVKPYIRKYIHTLYGYPVVLDLNSLLGSILVPILQKKRIETRFPQPEIQQRLSYLTSKVECHGKIWRTGYQGISLPAEHIIVINCILENQFNDDLYKWVHNKTGPAIRYKGYNEALRSFMKFYCIEEDVDISFETIKKAEYRRRTRIENNRKKLIENFVPNLFSNK